MKTFLYVLITNFVFAETDEKVVKSNVCVNIVLKKLFSTGGRRPGINLTCQGDTKAYRKKKVQGRESLADIASTIYTNRIRLCDYRCFFFVFFFVLKIKGEQITLYVESLN